MGIVDSKTFQCGDDVAVELPDEVAFPAGIAVKIERTGDVIRIWPAISETKRQTDG